MMSLATYAMDNTRESSMSREAIGARILLRSCAAFQGAVLLTERGMVAEGRTLVRNLVESSFCVAALVTAPEKFIKLIKDDSEASRQNQRKFVLDNGLAKSDISQKN